MSDGKDFKYLIRVVNTDLDGNKQLVHALTKIKGVGVMFANAACHEAGIAKTKKAGTLSDTEVKTLNDIIQNPDKHGFPLWMYNRRMDPETGDDKHLLTSDLQFTQANDKKLLAMIKSYRGLRLQVGLTVRGQKTKSNFRKSKTRGGGSLGVKRKK